MSQPRKGPSKRFSDKLFDGLLNTLQDGILVMDKEGVLLDINPAFCKMSGYSKEELLGLKPPFPYWATDCDPEIGKRLEEFKNISSGAFELTFIQKDGIRFPVSVTTSTVKKDSGEFIAYISTIQNITDRILSQQLISKIEDKSNLYKTVIMDLSGLIGSGFNFALRRIASLSSKAINVEKVSIWKFNKDHSQIHCEIGFNLSDGTFTSGATIGKEDNPRYFNALEKYHSIAIEDAVHNDITKQFSKNYIIPEGITSMLDLFIKGAYGAYGIICFEHVGPIRVWSPQEQDFANSIANMVSLMVESSQRKIAEKKLLSINEDLRQVNDELKTLKIQLINENSYLRKEIDLVFNYEEMVYGSNEFSEVLNKVESVAATNATVLLFGETGTGKELLARAIHNIGSRKNKPLIKVNCAAIPRELIESELFGHKKGSFTGAVNDKIGKFELADGGTLFLDEIGDMPLEMQPKLLRFLQEGEIEKVGESMSRKMDVRIIVATNKDLKKEVLEKSFREDLYFRINVFPIEVPPLRKRKEDIPLLFEHFVNKFSKIYKKDIQYISDSAVKDMQSYKWPGNIRELENLVERAVILSTGESLVLPEFGTAISNKERLIASTSLTLDDAQRNYIIKTLEKCHWKIDGTNGASKILDIKPSTLRDRMKKFGIKKPK